ncbi:Nicotianamine synthase 2 [Achaetomium macrosporum]|uniref:Nicotianamine synthase 2 n=1 Tax=Achaetomium macrosporum TaxID=79813 RepID=A0AAN7C6I2_9PEZI|nr:Nicotianamine synthase 2 [Achaetomium macrosporum]
MPSCEIGARDLEAEIQAYVSKVSCATAALEKLYPLDTPEKVDQAIRFWSDIYGCIAFTTLDTELEEAILTHRSMSELMPEVRRATVNCEAAFEIATARRMALARDAKEARAILDHGPAHIFYQCFAHFEWAALLAALNGRVPDSVAILGSGALPETAIWIADWARANGKRIHVHNVEMVQDRLELSRQAYQALGELKDDDSQNDVRFQVGNARNTPSDLSGFDAVYFNATVGSTVREKESILLDVASRMRKGAHVVTRSTYSLKTMAYPPASIQSSRILAKLRPVVTLHSSGEAGKTVNATVIVSRVV